MSTKKIVVKPLILIIIFLSFLTVSNAQIPITLQAAIDTAITNNLNLRSDRLNAEYLQKLKGAAYTIPQTNASFEYGQINSFYSDNRLSLTQSIKFPTVYARQKALYEEEWKSGVLNIAVRQYEIKKQVTRIYYQMIYLQQKQKLLLHIDSLFAEFLKNAELRLKAGESNILEKTTAETQRGQINVQLREVQQDFTVLQLQFKWLLNTVTDFIPSENVLKFSTPLINDTSLLLQHPSIKLLQQQQRISIARLQLEKSRLSPDLFMGYNNVTMKGSGADGKTYSGSKRFQSVQFGVGIPLFKGAQRATIAAGRIYVQLAENNYAQGLQQFQSVYLQAIQEYNKNLQTINYYEGTALKNAETIITIANLQFKNGEINYLEWVLLTNNAIAIQSEYINAIKQLNESIITINSFTNK